LCEQGSKPGHWCALAPAATGESTTTRAAAAAHHVHAQQQRQRRGHHCEQEGHPPAPQHHLCCAQVAKAAAGGSPREPCHRTASQATRGVAHCSLRAHAMEAHRACSRTARPGRR
jgi:hypothetical protein